MDYGSVWQLFYLTDDNTMGSVTFDHRPFAHFYEGATGRSFRDDYRFGQGREYISKQLQDKRILVDGQEFIDQVVRLED